MDDVRKLSSFYEWILDVHLSMENRLILAAMYREIMKDRMGHFEEYFVIRTHISTIEQVIQQDQDTIVFWRESNQAAFVANLRASQDRLSRQLVALYDQANAPLVRAEPPLTEEVVECSLGIMYFMSAVVQDTAPEEIPLEEMRRWKGHIMQIYPMLPSQDRDWFANSPLVLATMKVSWPQTADDQKAVVRVQWAGELQSLSITPIWAGFVPQYLTNTSYQYQQSTPPAPVRLGSSAEEEEQQALADIQQQMRTTQMLINFNSSYYSPY
jgi:hypothetical protein